MLALAAAEAVQVRGLFSLFSLDHREYRLLGALCPLASRCFRPPIGRGSRLVGLGPRKSNLFFPFPLLARSVFQSSSF